MFSKINESGITKSINEVSLALEASKAKKVPASPSHGSGSNYLGSASDLTCQLNGETSLSSDGECISSDKNNPGKNVNGVTATGNNDDSTNGTRRNSSEGTNSMLLRDWMAQAQRVLLKDASSLSDRLGDQNSPKGIPASAATTTQCLDLSHPSPSNGNPSNRPVPVVSSKAYLSAALKIGHSLAAQLCGNKKLEWVDSVNVEQVLIEFSSPREHDSRDSDHFNRPISPLGFKRNDDHQNGEVSIEKLHHQEGSKLNYSKNGICDDDNIHPDGGIQLPRNFSFSDFSIDGLLEKESDVVNQLSETDRSEIKSIFNISGAHFSMEKSCTQESLHLNRISKDNKIEIYELGLVFYELFSGGLKFPLIKSSSSDRAHDEEFDVSNDPRYEPLPTAESTAIDLTSALKLLTPDDISPEASFTSLEAIEEIHSDANGSNLRAERDSNRNKRIFADSFVGEFDSSIMSLNLLLVPPTICDLVSNMIDSINGDLGREDAYNSMDNVLNDLRWMMKNLDRILDNADTNKIVTRGLQIDNLLYGRESEISQLMEAYKQSLCGVSLALISGPSGTGKSQLANQVALHSLRSGGQFLKGKFDQLQQAKPFSAISSAFDDYCCFLIQKLTSESKAAISSKVQERIGPDGINVLSKLIPNLKSIFEPSVIVNSGQDDSVNAQKRIHYFLGHFVEVISKSSAAGFTLFLDDLQWADSSSIQFIHQLLLRFHFSRSTNKINFFFLGCFRDGEITSGDSFQNFINNVHTFGLNMTRIHLKGMDKECVNTMMSDVLCLPPRLTRPLSEVIHHKTQGNQLFVIQLLKSLHKEGLIFVSLKQRRWDWEIERINARGVSDDVAMILSGAINSLPQSVKESLCIASCFGASLEHALVQILERHLGIPLSSQLEIAVEEGLLDKRGGDWYFVHDKVQEAAYNEMKPEDRCLHHFNYGLSLSSVALEEKNDDVLIKAVDQINKGGPSAISDRSQSSIVAELNLKAGNISVDRSDSSTAFSFYDHGISFLRKGHWREHYKLSLELHVQAVHCALVIGDFSSLAILSEKVMANATSFDDKLPVMYAKVQALEVVSKFPEAIEKGLSVLRQLGVLFDQSSSWKTDGLLEETKNMLNPYSDSDLLRLRKMEDPKKVMTMKFLKRMVFLLGVAKPSAQPEATLIMVQLSLRHGLSSLSPFAFVLYGSLLGSLGEIREGYRYVKIAFNLLDNKELSLTKEAASETYAMGSQVMTYVQPYQGLFDFMFRAHEIGLETGDTYSALLCLISHSATVYWGGKNLQWVRSSMEDSLKLMMQYNNIAWMTQLLPLYRSVLLFIGEKEGIDTPMGKCLTTKETERETFLLKRNTQVSKYFNFNKMYAAYIFRDFSETKKIAENYFHYLPTFVMHVASASNTFYRGLISFWIARKETIASEQIWFDRGERALSDIKRWSNSCNWNFLHKFNLLEAERCYCLREMDKAKKFYLASILNAKEHKFIHEEALACELAGYFFDDIGETDLAMTNIERSLELYQAWGAFAKANHLSQYMMCSK